jgi:hypothetical protein
VLRPDVRIAPNLLLWARWILKWVEVRGDWPVDAPTVTAGQLAPIAQGIGQMQGGKEPGIILARERAGHCPKIDANDFSPKPGQYREFSERLLIGDVGLVKSLVKDEAIAAKGIRTYRRAADTVSARVRRQHRVNI